MSRTVKTSRSIPVGLSLPTHYIDFLEKWNNILNATLSQNMSWQKRLRLILDGFVFPIDATEQEQFDFLQEMQYILQNRTAKNYPRILQVVTGLNGTQLSSQVKEVRSQLDPDGEFQPKRSRVAPSVSTFLKIVDPYYSSSDLNEDSDAESDDSDPVHQANLQRQLEEADLDFENRRKSRHAETPEPVPNKLREKEQELKTHLLQTQPMPNGTPALKFTKPKFKLKSSKKAYLPIPLPTDYDPPLNFTVETATEAELDNLPIVEKLLAKKRRKLKVEGTQEPGE